MKKETLEDAINREFPLDYSYSEREAMFVGVKWQQEQDSNWFNEYQEVENYIISKIGDNFLKATPEKYETASKATIALLNDNWKEERSYSKKEVLEQLNLLYSMKNSTVDTFTDEDDYITMKWFEQFKK